MTKEEFLQSGLIEQHVLGLTSPEEEQIVEQFLQIYPELRDEISQLHEAMQQYANQYAIPPVKQSLPITDAANNGLQNSTKAAPTLRSRTAWLYGLAGLFVMIAFGQWNNNQQYRQQITQLEAEYAALASYCDLHEQKARAIQALHDKAKLPSTQKLVVGGTSIAPNCFAVAYWNTELQEGWLDPTKLPPLPAERQYQIWADIDGEMINIGLIPKENNSMITIKFLPEAESINITQEALGGADHPTVDLLTANGYL